eukprot:4889696-Pleurochrysis_carterae.AAC.1
MVGIKTRQLWCYLGYRCQGGQELNPGLLVRTQGRGDDLQNLCPASKRRIVSFVAGESGDRMAPLTRHIIVHPNINTLPER